MIDLARAAGIKLGVMSQHRFDDSTIFLKRAIGAGRLGKLLEADAYVKWFRSDEYYSRPIKGSWKTEGGGALINQAIHQVDILLHLIGPVAEVSGLWQLGARHKIESEDVVSAQFLYRFGRARGWFKRPRRSGQGIRSVSRYMAPKAARSFRAIG
jgi:UDP-N-acetyl-2-amino-2-deoxyglucuronate dehydrogenase